MKRQMKKLIVSAVALSLVIPALSAPKAEAAKKPSLVKKVSVKAGKTCLLYTSPSPRDRG